MEDFEKLIAEFEALPKQAAPTPTFMQIAGYPHYENVCSNILKFFFDTSEAHQLGNLFLKSLLDLWTKSKSSDLKLLSMHHTKTNQVLREVPLDDKKRIDLIIEAGELVVTIENKIYHWLANDLGAYKAHVLKSFPDSKTKIFLVLGIRKEPNVSHDFESITYAEFFAKIKENIGEYLIRGDNRYIAYLLDFMESIEKHYMGNETDEAKLDFFQSNWSKIDALQGEYKNWIKAVGYRIQELGGILKERPASVKKWIYEKHTLVHDLEIEGRRVAVDCEMWFKELKIKIFPRAGDGKSFEFIQSQLSKLDGEWVQFQRGHQGYERIYSTAYFTRVDLGTLAMDLDKILNAFLLPVQKMIQDAQLDPNAPSPEANVQ